MSCYEWESGTITLPAAEVSKMRAALNTAHLAQTKRVTALLNRVWPEVKKLPADQRNRKVSSWNFPNAHTLADGETWGDLESLFYASKGRKPTAEHWKSSLAAPSTNRTREWRCGEATVSLEGRNLTWDVPDNNHAVDHARETWLGKALFTQLAKVKWTRGSGGYFVGNNEYNGDCGTPGAGGNYITESFGPTGKKAEMRHRGFTSI
ncbi:MAG: hypothetical protein DI630_31405 [Gordonia sp. (in: high G+C Gram-positive bacteria)]|nr:MAG: hypothetical protein DI630_31405 [Gordonia sp. (in: high G+C Gram-positive bacteria)]